MASMKAKALFLQGEMTITEVSPDVNVKSKNQLDIFPEEMSDEEILENADVEKFGDDFEVKVVTISW